MQGHSAVLAIAAGLGVGIGVGVVNGLFVTALVLPSFLVTLASMGIITGVARSITDLQAVAVVNQRFVDIFGRQPRRSSAWRSGRSARLRSATSCS